MSKSQSPRMFDTIATRYDFVNTLISLGLHKSWRRAMFRMLPTGKQLKVLDIASGTGDVAIALAKRPNISSVAAADLSQEMLKIAQNKKNLEETGHKISIETQDAQRLTYRSDLFDVITISFGIRNVADTEQAIREAFRTVKPGGRFIVLESGHPRNPILRMGHFLFTNYLVPLIGSLFSENPSAYRYLNATIRSFPSGAEFTDLLDRAGFKYTGYKPLALGSVYLYWGEK